MRTAVLRWMAACVVAFADAGSATAVHPMLAAGCVRPIGAVDDVRPRASAAACVPGGVAAIPLERLGDRWPARVAVTVGELRTTAPVVRVTPAAVPDGRWWTRSAEQVDVVMAADLAPAADGAASVFAMVELPAVADGDLTVAGVPVAARWLPAPQRVRADAPLLSIPATFSDDRPDPSSAVDYWRWTLLADRLGVRLGEPRGTPAARLWARHVASLWAGGLERVRVTSRGAHAEVLDALTGIASDPEARREVAAWIARPRELRTLNSILIDVDRSDADVTRAALTWLSARWIVTMWVEEDAGDRVRIAAANPTSGERVLRAEWVGSDGTAPPSAIVVPPRRVVHVWIDRPALRVRADQPLNASRERTESLELRDGTVVQRLAVGAREYPVRPPARGFGTFLPPLTLADAQAGALEPIDPAWATTAWLRRRMGNWEVLVEAMRPAGAAEPGRDEVIIRLGDPLSPVHAVSVTGAGELRMKAGADDGVVAGFFEWPDRWRARIELPARWIPAGTVDAHPLLISMERVPGAGAPRQTAGLPRPSWAPTVPPIIVDLAAWGIVH